MENKPTIFTVKKITEQTDQMRLLSLGTEKFWSFIPGQVAILGLEGIGESYYAIASAPEDTDSMEVLVKDGKGVSAALFRINQGSPVQGKGPVGKGFPIDKYHGRDLLIAAVGSAIAPMRGVIRSINTRRKDFGKVTLVYGARQEADIPFLGEMKEWGKSGIDVILTVSRPEGSGWTGKTGYVQSHFGDIIKKMQRPVVLICGLKAMMEQSRSELTRLNVAQDEILSNY